MKKKDILSLIKYYTEKDDKGFKNIAYGIAEFFNNNNDHELGAYIMGLLNETETFIPQHSQENSESTPEDFEENYEDFRKLNKNYSSLALPEKIEADVLGIINAVGHDLGINKFLLEGKPGTGKTETVKQIGRMLKREVLLIEFDSLIDSKLGQSSKNIVEIFKKINLFKNPEKVIILFDEIDAIALDRINSNDSREMGRVTSTMLKELDKLNGKILFIATTNLFEKFDKALTRRFDAIINFDRYSKDDLIEISVFILDKFLMKFKTAKKNMKCFKKILNTSETLPSPGELENFIKTSLAFSKPEIEYDYLKKIFISLIGEKKLSDIIFLKNQGFTVREIELLTGKSKSQVSRMFKGVIENE